VEVAKLILEYIKTLAWPLVLLILVFRFSMSVESIILRVSERLGTAETLKVGIMGSQVEISGTAKELLKERHELISQGGSEEARQFAQKIDQSVPRLSNPMSDLVGISLLRGGKQGLSLEEIIEAVWKAFSPEQKPPDLSPMAVIALSTELEKILMELKQLDLVSESEGKYQLTSRGRELFEKVSAKQEQLLRKFFALPKQ
jgi:hypothetical protein